MDAQRWTIRTAAVAAAVAAALSVGGTAFAEPQPPTNGGNGAG